MRGEGTKADDGPPVDEVLAIAACQKGDRNAYELLVKRYAARATGVARSFLRDSSLAEDAAQEAFVRAFRAIRRFDLKERFYPWFYRILRNVCLSAIERRPKRETSLDASTDPPAAAREEDPSAAASRGELRGLIFGAMALLTEAHREILLLAHFQELSYREIADCLGIPLGTVMSRLWAARRALADRLRIGE